MTELVVSWEAGHSRLRGTGSTGLGEWCQTRPGTLLCQQRGQGAPRLGTGEGGCSDLAFQGLYSVLPKHTCPLSKPPAWEWRQHGPLMNRWALCLGLGCRLGHWSEPHPC